MASLMYEFDYVRANSKVAHYKRSTREFNKKAENKRQNETNNNEIQKTTDE